jgi:hypothetical protein
MKNRRTGREGVSGLRIHTGRPKAKMDMWDKPADSATATENRAHAKPVPRVPREPKTKDEVHENQIVRR